MDARARLKCALNGSDAEHLLRRRTTLLTLPHFQLIMMVDPEGRGHRHQMEIEYGSGVRRFQHRTGWVVRLYARIIRPSSFLLSDRQSLAKPSRGTLAEVISRIPARMVARDTGNRHSSFFSALGFSGGRSCGLDRTGSSSFSAKADTTYAAWTEMTAAQMRLDVKSGRP